MIISKLKHRWKWRKAKRSEYPLIYTGPTHTVYGVKIENGTPLRQYFGNKGAVGGARYLAPDDVIRLLPSKQVKVR